MIKIYKLVISIGVSLLAGVVGSIFTVSAIQNWYATLQKPAFSPPNWVFGPAWTTLYVLMGIAVFLVWREGFERKDVKNALAIFSFQLLLNVFWSVIFFGFKNPGAAFI